MSNEKINSQIALLQEQIYNLEQSGHFTEKEMDSKTFAFRSEIEYLKTQLLPLETVLGVSSDELTELVDLLKDCVTKKPTYGMTLKIYIDGAQKHNQYFSQMPSPASELIKEIALQHVSYFPLIPSPALMNTWKTLGMNQINRG